MRLIKFFLSLVFFLIVVGCKKDPKQKIIDLEKEIEKLTMKNPLYDPVDGALAARMQSSFKTRTYDTLLKLKLINNDEFILAKNEWKEMCDFLKANNQTTVIRLYFVQYNGSKFGSKYADLKDYDGKLYIIIGYFDKYQKLVGGKFYGMLSLNKSIVVDPTDLEIMHQDYKDNIKVHINKFCDKKDNTDYIKIEAKDFEVQRRLIEAYDDWMNPKQVKQLRFKLAEVQDPSGVIVIRNKDYYIKKYKDDLGQLTTLTDVEDLDSHVIRRLTNYDMNSLCPQQCP